MKRVFPLVLGSVVMLAFCMSIISSNVLAHANSVHDAHTLAQMRLFKSPMHPDKASHAATYSGICDTTNTARIYEGPPVNQCVGFFGTGYLAGRWSPIQFVYAWDGYPLWIRYYDYSVAEYCWIGAGNGVQGQNTSGTITQIDIGTNGNYLGCTNPLPHG